MGVFFTPGSGQVPARVRALLIDAPLPAVTPPPQSLNTVNLARPYNFANDAGYGKTLEKGCGCVNSLTGMFILLDGFRLLKALANSGNCGKILHVMPHGGCQDTVNLEPDKLAPIRKGKTMGDLSNIVDMLKDFKTFGKNLVELFRAVPDILVRFGSLGDKAKELPFDTSK